MHTLRVALAAGFRLSSDAVFEIAALLDVVGQLVGGEDG